MDYLQNMNGKKDIVVAIMPFSEQAETENFEQTVKEWQKRRREWAKQCANKRKIEELDTPENLYCEYSVTCLNRAKYKIKASNGEIAYGCEKHKDMVGENFTWTNYCLTMFKHKNTSEYKYAYEIVEDGGDFSDYEKISNEESRKNFDKCIDIIDSVNLAFRRKNDNRKETIGHYEPLL